MGLQEQAHRSVVGWSGPVSQDSRGKFNLHMLHSLFQQYSKTSSTPSELREGVFSQHSSSHEKCSASKIAARTKERQTDSQRYKAMK